MHVTSQEWNISSRGCNILSMLPRAMLVLIYRYMKIDIDEQREFKSEQIEQILAV